MPVMKVLAIGIHPDDVEMGCGGTVILAVSLGHDVTVLDLSDGSSSSNGTVQDRRREAAAAAAIMGVARRSNLGLPDTGICSEDPEQVRTVVAAIREAGPDIVFLPSHDDPHPDHASGGVLIKRALYLAGTKGYEPGAAACRVRHALIYPGRTELTPQFVVDISSTYEAKRAAVLAHETQFLVASGREPTPLNSLEFLPFLEARCRLYGHRIGVAYGEPFRTLAPVGLRNLDLFAG